MRKRGSEDSIAIIGLAFRFPGDLSDEQSFLRALEEGRDVIGRIGEERWAVNELEHSKRSEPGKSITFSAGVLSRIDEFDASFFGISPREASWLDPQQRLLLELAWEAMENAGQVPDRLAGSDSAVFVGISSLDYGVRGVADLAAFSPHVMTGNTLSIAANRLSYIFDLRGPSLSVDTACSSSLVALHQACNSLRRGEAKMALVGGVNMLLHPYPFIGFTKASMISGGGKCRAFDASADGYVRAEGGAVLLLKPLAQAEKDGDPIHAVILASGINADGGQKTGITIPSSAGQTALMRSVLKRAKLAPGQIDYIEAHGTGTSVGDPIEARAIGDVYGRERKAPLPIGSVKSNLGHLEAASGMAGLVKIVTMLKHRQLLPSINFHTPNPNIDFAGLNLRVVTECVPLKKPEEQAPIMGVNSFGFGGANAHVLLQGYLPPPKGEQVAGKVPAPPLALSARTPDALCELAGQYADLLNSPEPIPYYDIAYSAAFHRQHLEHRLVVKGKDGDAIAALLARFAQRANPDEIVVEKALAAPASLAFIYSGNGAQYVGMGQQLLAEMPRFGEIIADLDAAMKEQAGFSILKMLNASEADSKLDDTSVAQPLLFAMQVGLTKLLREQGLEADAVAGHSTGEVAAAWASGALTLEQAITVICARSAAQAKARGGKMAAAGMSEDAIRKVIKDGKYKTIEVAGINSASNVTLAGSFEELDDLRKKLEANDKFFRILDLDYAFHSRSMDPIREDLAARLGDLTAKNSTIDFVSTVTGKVLKGKNLGAAYWWDNVRQPVRFAKAMETLIARGCRVFVEIGPNAILQRYMTECLAAMQTTGCVLPTLRKKADGADRLNETAMRARLCAPTPDFKAWFPVKGNFVPLPNYPWQREKFWIPRTSEFVPVIENRRVHPLLGWRLKDCEAVWENTLDIVESPWLADHCVAGAIVFPGAGYVEVALAASREWFGGNCLELEELEILSPIVFDGEQGRSFRFELNPQGGTFRFLSRPRLSEDEWSLNAKGRLLAPGKTEPERVYFKEIDGDRIEADDHYKRASELGLAYGPAFRGLVSANVSAERMTGELVLPQPVEEASASYVLHPAVLDSCFQALINFFRVEIEVGIGTPYLPIKVGRLRFFGGASPAAFDVKLKRRGLRSVLVDISLFNGDGKIVGILENCRFRAAFMQRKGEAEAARWRIDAEVVPHPVDEAADVVNSAELKSRVRAWFVESEDKLKRKKYLMDGLPLFNALAVAFAYSAFKEHEEQDAGWIQNTLSTLEGQPFKRRAFLLSLKRCLQNAELLKEVDGKWTLELVDAPPPAEEIWCTLLADFPEALPELLFTGRVGRNLNTLLGGWGDELKTALEKSAFFQSLYDDAPFYRGMNLALAEALRVLAAAWPQNRRLRVLEISGGSTKLAYELASVLPADRADYVKASEDGEKLGQLKAEYQGHPFISVAVLKTEDMSLTAEVKLPAQYDVIVAHHWLSRTANPTAALGALRHMLAKGGRVIVVERPRSYVADLMFGLMDGWWHGTNEPVSCLMAPEGLGGLMKAHGFEDIETVVEPEDEETRCGAYLVLAKAARAMEAEEEASPACWLIVADKAGVSAQVGEKIATRLKSKGQHVVVSPMGADVCGDAAAAMGKIDHVVYLAGMRQDDSAEASESSRCYGAMRLVHALAAKKHDVRLWLLTNGGALVTEARADWVVHPAEAQLWGFGRVVMNEQPNLNCTLIDIASHIEDAGVADRLLNELLAPDGESEVVLAREARFGLRMRRDEEDNNAEAPRFKLDFRVPGQLRNLLWLPQEARGLKDDEIEVRPLASGINFRDVMYTMGLLPDEAVEHGFSGPNLGLEFAGIVSRVGGKVLKVKPGDEVMGFGSACFSSHVVTKEGAVARKPEGWSFAQAATVPTAFFTVYYALKHLANLQPGERILIHGAAGGVGIAAMQIARHMGAEIFVTAGSEEKRDFVRLLGAEHVSDSRSYAFADDILAQTDGEGVDVVLNSLAGEAINRNLRVLKPFGRFLELGKRDFFENTHIGLRPFKDNINYYGIDTDQLLTARPELAARLFDEVMALFDDGALFPLPYSVFPAERIVDAFRYMQQSKHIGKVVVDLSNAKVEVEQIVKKKDELKLESKAAYLVTGGLGGFGLESAKWLAERGARHLVLLSRRGMAAPGAEDAVAQIEALGARAHVFACDVADRAALETVFEAMKSLPPLKGILHAAAVFDDALLMNLDEKRFRAVLTPKVMGAWNLHELSREKAIDFFVLYSSVTTSIGNPGQANYVSANAYLQALASWRRKQGLPATCANWGPIGDAGYLTRNTDVKDSLANRLGSKPLSARQALDELEQLILQKKSDITVADFEWNALSRILPSAACGRFDALRRAAGSGNSRDSAAEDIYLLIAGKPIEEVNKIVKELIIVEVAKILCIGPERIDSSKPLSDIGMDSLMVVELALAIEQRMGVNLPAMALSEGSGSIDKLCAKLAEKLCGGGEEKKGDNLETLVDAMAAQHNESLSAEVVAETVAEIKRQTHSEVRRIA